MPNSELVPKDLEWWERILERGQVVAKFVFFFFLCLSSPVLLLFSLRLIDNGPLWTAPKVTYAETVTIVLTAVTIILGAVAIFLALVAVWGFTGIKTEAARAAEEAAKKRFDELNLKSYIEAQVKRAQAQMYSEAFPTDGAAEQANPLGEEYPEDEGKNKC